MKHLWKKAWAWTRGLWRDELGSMVENLGWMIAVSVGVVVIGAVIYAANNGLGGRVSSKVNGFTGP